MRFHICLYTKNYQFYDVVLIHFVEHFYGFSKIPHEIERVEYQNETDTNEDRNHK